MSQSTPQQNNPILQYYQRWSEQTPYVTKATMIGLLITYFFSFFFQADMVLGNLTYFTVFRYEIYRVLVSPLVGNSIFMIILIALFFPTMGGKMESSCGSSKFLYLMFLISMLTNLSFCLICSILSVSGMPEALFWNCSGFWLILFSLITIECLLVPDQPRRIMFIPLEIPSKYYPLILYAFFSLFSGPELSFAISIGIGYLYMKGYLDKLMISSYYFENMESPSGIFHSISRTRGWVLSGAALGHDAWIAVNADRGANDNNNDTSNPSAPLMNWGNNADTNDKTNEPKKESFPGQGKKLGNVSSGGSLSNSVSSAGAGANSAPLTREALAAKRLAAMGQKGAQQV